MCKLAVASVMSISLGAVPFACKDPQTAQTASGVLTDAATPTADACVKLSAVDSSGTLQEICAFLPDIIAVAALIIPALAAKPGDSCELLAIPDGGDQLERRCFTNAQRLQIIRTLRSMDGGLDSAAPTLRMMHNLPDARSQGMLGAHD